MKNNKKKQFFMYFFVSISQFSRSYFLVKIKNKYLKKNCLGKSNNEGNFFSKK